MVPPLPGLPSFDYLRAESVAQASELLRKHRGQARLLLGGTDLLVQMRNGLLSPAFLVDVKRLPGLADIQYNQRQGLRVGAAVTMNALARHPAVREHFPLLVEAANSVASYQLRSRATIGGNLCNASPAADLAPSALVLEAVLVCASSRGERRIPADKFFLGPGQNALKLGELLVRFDFPTSPKGARGCYLKLGRNAEGDLAIVGVAVLGYRDEASPCGFRFRLALASVAPTPIRIPAAEELLAAGPVTASAFDEAARLVQEAVRPISDVRASAHYRKAMAGTFARRALAQVWSALQEG